MAFTSRNISHPPGVWGPVTATLDWCEENYQFSPYIAEMANTLSNLISIAFAAYGAYRSFQANLPKRFAMAFVWFGIVGLGSFAFHGTLLYGAQLADELPMIYSSSWNIFILFDTQKGFPEPMQTRTRMLANGILLFDLIFSLSYMMYRNPVYHQVTFGILMFIITARTEWIIKQYAGKAIPTPEIKKLRRTLLVGTVTFSLGFVVWNLDNLFCDNITAWKYKIGWPAAFVLEGHSWWHFLTGAGTYIVLVGTGYLALLVKDSPNSYTLESKLGLPYISRLPTSIRSKRID